MKKRYAPYVVVIALLVWIAFLVLWIALDPHHGAGPP